jgi:2-phosphoglycerate kinase
MSAEVDTNRSLAVNILWIGGSPCSGKSSVSDLLANQYDLQLYRVDDALRHQLPRIVPARHPTLSAWLAASGDERWLKPIDTLVGDAIGCYRDHFSLVAEDLFWLHEKCDGSLDRPILVEGTALLPTKLTSLRDQ